MTHLSRDVRLSAIDVLSWLTGAAGTELVSCAGGWYKTLECFTTMLSWNSSDVRKWSTSKPSLGDTKSAARIVTVLAEFLEAGVLHGSEKENIIQIGDTFPLWQTHYHQIPTKSNAYSYLNLFGAPRDVKNEMLEDYEDRVHVYNNSFRSLIDAGVARSKQEGGELGRATGLLNKVLENARLDDTNG